jgi:hypothetical protein
MGAEKRKWAFNPGAPEYEFTLLKVTTIMELIYKDEAYAIISACFEVYNEVGFGFGEPIYQVSASGISDFDPIIELLTITLRLGVGRESWNR